MSKEPYDAGKIHQSADLRYLHYRNFRIGRNSSRLNSLALGFIAPIMSGELLFKSLLTILVHPIRGIRSVFRWAIGLVLLVACAPFGMVYLADYCPPRAR